MKRCETHVPLTDGQILGGINKAKEKDFTQIKSLETHLNWDPEATVRSNIPLQCGCTQDNHVINKVITLISTSAATVGQPVVDTPSCCWMSNRQIARSYIWGLLIPGFCSTDMKTRCEGEMNHEQILFRYDSIERILASGARYFSLSLHRVKRRDECVIVTRLINGYGHCHLYEINCVLSSIRSFLLTHPTEVIFLSLNQARGSGLETYPSLIDVYDADMLVTLNFERKLLADHVLPGDATVEELLKDNIQLVYLFAGQERVISQIRPQSRNLCRASEGSQHLSLNLSVEENRYVQEWTSTLSILMRSHLPLDEDEVVNGEALSNFLTTIPPPPFMPNTSSHDSMASDGSSTDFQSIKSSRTSKRSTSFSYSPDIIKTNDYRAFYTSCFPRLILDYNSNRAQSSELPNGDTLSTCELKEEPTKSMLTLRTTTSTASDTIQLSDINFAEVPVIETVLPPAVNQPNKSKSLPEIRFSPIADRTPIGLGNAQPRLEPYHAAISQWLTKSLWRYQQSDTKLLSCCLPPVPIHTLCEMRGIRQFDNLKTHNSSMKFFQIGSTQVASSMTNVTNALSELTETATNRNKFDQRFNPVWNHKAVLASVPPKNRSILNKNELRVMSYRHFARTNTVVESAEYVRSKYLNAHHHCPTWMVPSRRVGAWGNVKMPHSRGKRVTTGTTSHDRIPAHESTHTMVIEAVRFTERYSSSQRFVMPFLVLCYEDIRDFETSQQAVSSMADTNKFKRGINKLTTGVFRRDRNRTESNIVSFSLEGDKTNVVATDKVRQWISCLFSHPTNQMHFCNLADDLCAHRIHAQGLSGMVIDWPDKEIFLLLVHFNLCNSTNQRGRGTTHLDAQRRAKWDQT